MGNLELKLLGETIPVVEISLLHSIFPGHHVPFFLCTQTILPALQVFSPIFLFWKPQNAQDFISLSFSLVLLLLHHYHKESCRAKNKASNGTLLPVFFFFECTINVPLPLFFGLSFSKKMEGNYCVILYYEYQIFILKNVLHFKFWRKPKFNILLDWSIFAYFKFNPYKISFQRLQSNFSITWLLYICSSIWRLKIVLVL